jgi:hypothetical protein
VAKSRWGARFPELSLAGGIRERGEAFGVRRFSSALGTVIKKESSATALDFAGHARIKVPLSSNHTQLRLQPTLIVKSCLR